MKTVCLLFVAMLLILPRAPAFSETSLLTLGQAVGLALKNNLDIRQAEKDIAIAQAQLDLGYADLFIPQVGLSGNYSLNDMSSIQNSYQQIRIGSTVYTLTNSYPDNYSAGLTVSKTLFAGFKYWNAVQAQGLNLDLARAKYNDKVRSVKTDTETQFYRLVVLKMAFDAAAVKVTNLKDRMDYTGANYKIGRATELDYLQARVNYRTGVQALTKADNDFDSGRQTLCDTIGLTNAADVEFAGSLERFTNLRFASVREEALVLRAVSNDITLKALDYSLSSTRLSRDTTDNSKWPTLSGNFDYKLDYRRTNSMLSDRWWEPGWSVGLSLSIPIDDWIYFSKTAGSVRELDATLEKYKQAREQEVGAVFLSARAQWRSLGELLDAIDAQLENRALAERQLAMAKDQAGSGRMIDLDYRDSELVYLQALLAYWQAVYDYAAAVLKLDCLTGGFMEVL